MQLVSRVLLTLTVLVTATAGCSSPAVPEAVTTADEVVANALAAADGLASYAYKMEATANAEVENEGGLAGLSRSESANAVIDREHGKARMEGASAVVESDNGRTVTDEQTVHSLLVAGDRVYAGEAEIGQDIDWYSGPGAVEALESLDWVQRQLWVLQQSQTVLLGSDETAGVPCHVLGLEPDPDTLLCSMVLPTGIEELMLEGRTPEDLMPSVSEYTFKQWYAKESFFPMKVYQHMTIVESWDGVRTELIYEWTWDFDRHNEQFSIEVPAEAAGALLTDPYLGEAIREAIGKPSGPLRREDLESLTVLECPNSAFNDISGLEYCVNLTRLELWVGTDDLSPLSSLVNLTALSLTGWEIEDISPLSSLTDLTTLTLHCENVEDISPLCSLANVGTLDLYWNPEADITALSCLPDLTSLSLDGRKITDISALESLAHVTALGLWVPKVSDISPLSSLTGLQSLSLEVSRTADLSPVASLTNLNSLKLSRHDICDLSVVSSLLKLTSLELDRNDVTDVSALSGLTGLTHLDLSWNGLADLSPLSSLANLVTLELGNNEIADLSPLSSLTNLRTLGLAVNEIEDIAPLSPLTSLADLNLVHNDVVDISPLSGLTNLTYLTIWGNPIADISPLLENEGLGEGDEITIGADSVGQLAVNTIGALEERGVVVNLY